MRIRRWHRRLAFTAEAVPAPISREWSLFRATISSCGPDQQLNFTICLASNCMATASGLAKADERDDMNTPLLNGDAATTSEERI